MECNAPKIVAALVYLATFGRVTIPVDAVRMILRKGTASRVSQIVASLFADWPYVHHTVCRLAVRALFYL